MSREISLSEVKKHKGKDSVWVVIHNDVYDVSKFLDEHPGGADPLVEVAGQDGTQGFEDVGHSSEAREMMKKYKIGTLPLSEHNKNIPKCRSLTPKSEYKPPPSPRVERRVQTIVVPRESSNLKWAILALAGAIVIGIVIKKYAGSS